MNLLGFVPLKWRFQTRLAVRHLMTGGGRAVLTIGAVVRVRG
jgi:hypothetical protein